MVTPSPSTTCSLTVLPFSTRCLSSPPLSFPPRHSLLPLEWRRYQVLGKLSSSAKSSPFPVIRAQMSSPVPDYSYDVMFYKIEAILRPWRVPHVSAGLVEMGIRGVTISDVRGFGAQGGSMERHGGSEFSEDKFVSKVKMEIVVCKEQVEEVIDKIIENSRTGEIGDGKIFLIPVLDVIRVRTGERGEDGERMTGGRKDMISSNSTN